MDEKGNFLSQSAVPRMAQVSVSIMGLPAPMLSLSAPNMPLHRISLGQTDENAAEREITIHKDVCKGIDTGNFHAEWFSDFLGLRCRLVRQAPRSPRVRTPNSVGHSASSHFFAAA